MIIFKLVSFGIQLFIAVIILALLWFLLKLFLGWIMCLLIGGVDEKTEEEKKEIEIKKEAERKEFEILQKFNNEFKWICLISIFVAVFFIFSVFLITLFQGTPEYESLILSIIFCIPCPFLIKGIIKTDKKRKDFLMKLNNEDKLEK